MTIIESIILGVVQGITEFLPISSSGHLVLSESLLGLEVEALKSFDVALHVGSLLAILFYFRKTIAEILLKDHKYIGLLLVGTIPAVIAGFTLEDKIDALFRSITAVGVVMIITAIYFLIAEKFAPKKGKLTIKNAVLIGIAQMFALIPGVSRSGSTIATGVLTGLERTKAAEFSFLLGSIAITGAGLLTALKVEAGTLDLTTMSLGFFASMIASYFAIKFLMNFFKKNTLRPFAYYLFVIGVIAIMVSYA